MKNGIYTGKEEKRESQFSAAGRGSSAKRRCELSKSKDKQVVGEISVSIVLFLISLSQCLWSLQGAVSLGTTLFTTVSRPDHCPKYTGPKIPKKKV